KRQTLSRPLPNPPLPGLDPGIAGEGRVGARARARFAGARFLICLAFLLVVTGNTAPAHAQQFGAESFSLANGLQVVVLPNHRVPAVTQMVWYKIGAADDPRGKSGSAHFLEHLMFKGTRAHPPGEFSALISKSGGRSNAFTS